MTECIRQRKCHCSDCFCFSTVAGQCHYCLDLNRSNLVKKEYLQPLYQCRFVDLIFSLVQQNHFLFWLKFLMLLKAGQLRGINFFDLPAVESSPHLDKLRANISLLVGAKLVDKACQLQIVYFSLSLQGGLTKIFCSFDLLNIIGVYHLSISASSDLDSRLIFQLKHV